ncbi:hypothetical protein J4409_01660 [Candidatus Woesearchaeota archaeon]|nr:hypothetical protein [Candidatus Woesearchaeota archaeon]
MKVIIDYRERKSGIIRELAKHDIEVDEKQLLIGDFIIQTKDKDNNTINLCIEKKTQEDFLNSIIDRRLLKQLIDMKEHFQNQLLIIEGSKNLYSMRNFHPNAIRGILATISVDLKIPIITTRAVADTAAFIATITKRLEKPRSEISILKKRKPLTLKEQQEFIIESLPGIGPTLSKSLLQEFKSIKNIINAKEKDLKNIDKIGNKKAKGILNLIHQKYE